MRWIIAISFVLAVVGFLGIWIDLPGMARELTGPLTEWRRSANGWEIASTVTDRISDRIYSDLTSEPHPVIVSLLTALASTLSLVAFTPAKRTLLKAASKPNRGLVKRPKDFCEWIDNPRLK
jgi:hypothetical protein